MPVVRKLKEAVPLQGFFVREQFLAARRLTGTISVTVEGVRVDGRPVSV